MSRSRHFGVAECRLEVKVLLINEPFVRDFCRTQRWAARTRGRVLRAPDWLAYATAVLEAGGVEARLYDFPARNWGMAEYRDILRRERPDWVVLDSTTPSIHSDIACAREAKSLIPGCSVVMVGPHASSLPEETLLASNGAVDVIAIGEYDFTVRDVISAGSDLRGVCGVAFLSNGEVIRTPQRPPIEDLDSLPFPAWHQLDLLKYFDGTKLHPYIDIFSGRGCPHRCSFCLWPQVMHGTKVRVRRPEAVVDEMEYDIKLCPEVLRGGEFFFEDDTFTLHKPTAFGICEEILRRGLKVTFSVNARVDTADIEMMRMLKRAGCRELLVGFESGDEGILANMGKHAAVEDAEAFMRRAGEAGLDVHGCFVMGLPGETHETMERTLRWANGLGLHTVQYSAAIPFPGTRYFQYCEEQGLLHTKDWKHWLDPSGEQRGIVSYPGLSKEDVEAAVNRGLRSFYFRPSYVWRFLTRNRHFGDFKRKLRGAYHFATFLWGEIKRDSAAFGPRAD